MQIASQIFGIATAVNACIRFADGELAYITRRFDRREDGIKIAQEDFCQLSNRTEETAGRSYKYDGSYEEAGAILRRYCKAYPVEVEKLYSLIVFNYLISNGDAHLKNFSLHQSEFGDHVMTPAYDLICTSMHFPAESRTALDLFVDFETESFRVNGFYRRPDLLKLAELYGMKRNRAERLLDLGVSSRARVGELIARSFLSDDAKYDYSARFEDRLVAISD
jgi:serine/threonine-protein kinase HipA